MDAKPGIYALHKPAGPSSFAVLRDFRATWSERTSHFKACHGGTLDPFAEGLLLVLVGGATQLFELLHELPKTYEARVEWGRETDTGDALGRTTSQSPARPTAEAIENAARAFTGWTLQIPPSTSAKKIGGEPAYAKAHRGEPVALEPSRVFLGSSTFRHALPDASDVTLICRGGFYVRSWATELGRAVGCGAHVATLSRTAIGPFTLPRVGQTAFFAHQDCVPWLSTCTLTDAAVGELRAKGRCGGVPLNNPPWKWPRDFPVPTPRIAGLHGESLVALLTPDGTSLALERFLPRGI